MRVTTQGTAANSYLAISRTGERLADLQAQLTSQRRITKPSDDPAGTAQALALRSATRRDLDHKQASALAGSRLDDLDTTLQSVVTRLQGAESLVRQGLSSGTTDAAGRSALADQLDAIGSAVLGLANRTDADGHAVFAGTAATGAAFDADGGYLGNADVPRRAIGDATTVAVGFAGTTVFGSGDTSVFAALSDAASALRAGDTTAATDALTRLGAARQTVSAANAAVGTAQATLAATADAADTTRVDTAATLSTLQDVDVPGLAISLSAAQLAYNASVQAAARTSQTSLLDFLR